MATGMKIRRKQLFRPTLDPTGTVVQHCCTVPTVDAVVWFPTDAGLKGKFIDEITVQSSHPSVGML